MEKHEKNLELDLDSKAGKTAISIRLDNSLIEWAKEQAKLAGDVGYQTWINDTLCKIMQGKLHADQLVEHELRISKLEKESSRILGLVVEIRKSTLKKR